MSYIVRTILNGKQVHSQTVKDASELQDNKWVVFNKEVQLEEEAGDNFAGGTTGETTGSTHVDAREAFESYSFNVLGVPSSDPEILGAYVEYTKRMRDEYGVLFQLVIPYVEEVGKVNHEGIIVYLNTVNDDGYDPVTTLTYWLAGAEAGCKVQNSLVGKVYDGNFNINAKVTRKQQNNAIDNGQILFHKVGDDAVILKDINTLVEITDETKEEKNDDFKQNQTIRVLDGICIETAREFNTYFLGKEANDDIGRAALRSQLIKIREKYASIRAIQPYDSSLLVLAQGGTIRHVLGTDAVQPVNAMEVLQLAISVLG